MLRGQQEPGAAVGQGQPEQSRSCAKQRWEQTKGEIRSVWVILGCRAEARTQIPELPCAGWAGGCERDWDPVLHPAAGAAGWGSAEQELRKAAWRGRVPEQSAFPAWSPLLEEKAALQDGCILLHPGAGGGTGSVGVPAGLRGSGRPGGRRQSCSEQSR